MNNSATRILIAEDELALNDLLQDALNMAGYRTVSAKHGLEALKIIREQSPDLVILDINMPVMNGEDMMIRMKADPEMRDIPVIIISTEGSKTRIDSLTEMGAIFIRKPFTPEIVRDAVNRSLGTGDSYE